MKTKTLYALAFTVVVLAGMVLSASFVTGINPLANITQFVFKTTETVTTTSSPYTQTYTPTYITITITESNSTTTGTVS